MGDIISRTPYGIARSVTVTWTSLSLGVRSIALVAPAFHHLTVQDQGDSLAIRFGPLPLFRRAVRYDSIQRVQVGRTLFHEGWGIHHSFRGGWVWNLWGRDCVVVHFRNGKVLRIDTDDAENLARFLEGKIGQGER